MNQISGKPRCQLCAVLFQISKGHVLLAAKKSLNKDYDNKLEKVLEAFHEYHDRFNLDYKIIVGDSTQEIGVKNEYLDLIRTIQKHIGVNTIHRISKDDVEKYKKYKYVLSELADIVRGGNLRDPRVLAYCQPVLNISTGKYDTAEALMRLKLQDTGMVFPDKFIPLAEEYGYIHSLTKIMLQRTCDEIRYLVKENYDVKRISVNVSVLEMRDDNFIADIEKIISDSGIPKEKIAIEITAELLEKMADVVEGAEELTAGADPSGPQTAYSVTVPPFSAVRFFTIAPSAYMVPLPSACVFHPIKS